MNHDIIKHMTYRYKKACQAYRTSGGPDRLNYIRMSCAYLPRGTDKPSDTLVFALFKGMNCLLTLPKKRSVPMKKLKCLARKSSTRPLVKPAVPPAMFQAASNHFTGRTAAVSWA